MGSPCAQGYGEGAAGEEGREGWVLDVEAACEGAEGRKHQTLAVGDEAASPDAAGLAFDPSARMQMAGGLA